MTSPRITCSRRRFLGAGAGALLVAVMPGDRMFAATSPGGGSSADSFSREWLLERARQLAGQPFSTAGSRVAATWTALSYDQFRQVRVPLEARLWRGDNLPFQADLLPAGFLFREAVDIATVAHGRSKLRVPGAGTFSIPADLPVARGTRPPFSGLRILYPINRPDVMDEVIVFQGASYFRAVGRYENYGLSARGLAIRTGDPSGEEFPLFRAFWLETPSVNDSTIVVHALLDSASCTGAYRFSVRPGEATVVDVEVALFARTRLDRFGLAPLTSMFLFNGTNRERFQDFREAVHDSSGLLINNGRDEWLWRPLANPTELQVSAFLDESPHGFGLIQRTRGFADFQDLEAHYERRPSVWVEPIGDWGSGVVELVEIPSQRETDDNIVAYWRPRDAIPAGGAFSTAYRLHWGPEPNSTSSLARVVASRVGRSFDQQRLLFVVDFADVPALRSQPSLNVSSSVGRIVNTVLQPNPELGGLRASFEFEADDAHLAEFRLQLRDADAAASEVWLYRWTAA